MAFPCLAGCIMLMTSKIAHSFEMIISGRFLIGLACALHSLRNPGDDIDIELREFDEEDAGTTRKASLTNIWKQPHLRMALLVVVVSQIGQQFSGINGLLYYSVELFKSNGLSDNEATYATIGIGGVLLVITTVSVFIIDRLGRRLLLIGGLVDAFFCLIIFTECLIIKQITGMHWPVYIAITCSYIFVCGFAIGPGSIPWFLVAEMLPQENRDAALSIAVAVNWLCNICLGLGFIQLIKYIDIYAFLPSVGVEFIVICILWNYMPETMSRSVVEVEAEFKRMTRRNGAHVLIENDVTERPGSPAVRSGGFGNLLIQTEKLSKLRLLVPTEYLFSNRVINTNTLTICIQTVQLQHTLSVPNCHATRRLHEGWDTARNQCLIQPTLRFGRGFCPASYFDPLRRSNLLSEEPTLIGNASKPDHRSLCDWSSLAHAANTLTWYLFAALVNLTPYYASYYCQRAASLLTRFDRTNLPCCGDTRNQTFEYFQMARFRKHNARLFLVSFSTQPFSFGEILFRRPRVLVKAAQTMSMDATPSSVAVLGKPVALL
ncbi:solute carrier family 2 facilitated glucose transporter member 2 [Clonorchis sinensis]|uniref:Solute carrier family 2 facilitated glucose transporter member 2 n=1 Tax=Clonorchis sinensis TaxID=79923 RepID=G7YFU2_CLOSI|nr:solute carrier family 2 facilitated glucose transporter member 2 [Clonorchis sinensis]